MAINISIFQTIQPSRFLSFTIPTPEPSTTRFHLRVAVLDSPVATDSSPPRVAAMFVPKNRETDWLFSTESGHLQLLLSSPDIQRLVLIGDEPLNGPDPDSPSIYHRPTETRFQKRFEESIKPLVIALAPKSCFNDPSFDIPILTYEDNLVCSVVLEKTAGPSVGEMLVEDVEIESDQEMGSALKREFRRRLRFKRMPNLVQTEIRIVPEVGFDSASVRIGGESSFRPDLGVLVHVYLVPMVASLALIAPYLEQRIRAGFRPKALCLGVGGGALLGFLRCQLGFQVLGVEMDEEVLKVARKYFGLENGQFIRLCVGDAVEFMEKLARRASNDDEENRFYIDAGDELDLQFDIIMVDLDSSDVRNGVIAPPLDVVKKNVLLAARSILCESGIFVINVIPPTRSFYEKLKNEVVEVFPELYEIDVGNEENFVLIAKVLPSGSSASDSENSFLKRLRLATSGAYMESIKRI